MSVFENRLECLNRICILMYSREISVTMDSDITSLTHQGTVIHKVKLRCDRKWQYFPGSPKYTCLPLYVWIWKLLIWRSEYGSKTIYEPWQIAKRAFAPLFHFFSIFSIFPCIHIVPMGGGMLLYNQFPLAKIDGPHRGHLTQTFS